MTKAVTRKTKKLSSSEIAEINNKVFDSIGDLYMLTDKDFNIIDVNRPLCKKLGLTKSELLKRTSLDLDCNTDVYKKEMKRYQTLASKKPILFHFKYRAKNGNWQDYEVHYSSVIVKGKKYFASICREITEFVNLQQEIRESNDRFELMAGETLEGLWEMNLAENKSWANEAHQNYYGLTKEDPVPPANEWEKRIHPSVREKIIKDQQKAIKKKLPMLTCEYWFYTQKHGYIYIYDRALLSYDKKGKLIKMMGSMVNVTALKNAQEQVQNQKNLSEGIINSLPGVFYLFNQEGKFLRWNKNFEKVTGYSAVEVSNMKPEQFFDSKGGQILTEKINEVFKYGKAEMEGILLSKNGDESPFYFSGWKTVLEHMNCLIGVGIDMSEIKKAEESIKQMEREISEQQVQEQKSVSRAIIQTQERERNYIGRELHDNVNQLLAGARLYLSMGAKTSREFAELIKYPMELLDKGIREIRDLTHKNITPTGDKDLKQLSEGIMEILKAASIKCSLRYDLRNSLDDNLLINVYRILQELANNIIKHAKATKVNIGIKEKDGNLNIRIQDNGVGFTLNNIREGVGLYNISSRVQAYNGKVEITTAPGKGCKTNIVIPAFGKIKKLKNAGK